MESHKNPTLHIFQTGKEPSDEWVSFKTDDNGDVIICTDKFELQPISKEKLINSINSL